MYSVYQHWDPLRVCAVGRSYPPEFYSYINNARVRDVLERIAQETEEDYQSLIRLLRSFDVEVVRTEIDKDNLDRYRQRDRQPKPMMMTPRDWTVMIGDKFYSPVSDFDLTDEQVWNDMRGPDWPVTYPGWDHLEHWIQQELIEVHRVNRDTVHGHRPILDKVLAQGNEVVYTDRDDLLQSQLINSAMITRVGCDLYHGTWDEGEDLQRLRQHRQSMFPGYRNHVVDSMGHSDGCYCPVKPGLIISLADMPTYQLTFPGWEVVHLHNQGWKRVRPFLDLKEKNHGKWWVPGEELNDDFTRYVETWMDHWVGYVAESVFDVNMLVIDQHNVICNNENDAVFEAFHRHGVTPHVCNFRHRYFWDGGIHCITSDLDRAGTLQDHFPERDQP